jgi:hypothetical protein
MNKGAVVEETIGASTAAQARQVRGMRGGDGGVPHHARSHLHQKLLTDEAHIGLGKHVPPKTV